MLILDRSPRRASQADVILVLATIFYYTREECYYVCTTTHNPSVGEVFWRAEKRATFQQVCGQWHGWLRNSSPRAHKHTALRDQSVTAGRDYIVCNLSHPLHDGFGTQCDPQMAKYSVRTRRDVSRMFIFYILCILKKVRGAERAFGSFPRPCLSTGVCCCNDPLLSAFFTATPARCWGESEPTRRPDVMPRMVTEYTIYPPLTPGVCSCTDRRGKKINKG